GTAAQQLPPGGPSAVPLVEAELIDGSLLFLLSLFGQRVLDGGAPAIWSVLDGQRGPGEQPVLQGLRQVILELLDNGFLTDQHREIAVAFPEETVRQLRGCLEVPFDVRQPVALFLARPEWIGLLRKLFLDRLELLFVSVLVDRKGRL